MQKIKNYIRKLTLNKIENGNKRLENQKNNKSSKHNTDLYNFDIDIFIRLQKLVALINDGHTEIYGNIDFKVFPFKVNYFDDGYYILGADEKYKKYIGYKIESINGYPPDEIVEKLFNFVSADNSTGKKYYATKLLVYPDYLKFCGYSPPFVFKLKNIFKSKKIFKFKNVFKLKNILGKGKSENSFQITLSEKDLLLKPDVNLLNKNNKSDYFYLIDKLKIKPMYLQHLDKYYWYYYDSENKILYFQYNRCMNMKNFLFVDFYKELIDFIRKNDVNKLIVDLRFNGGGDSGLLTKFIDKIVNIEKINKYGHLFVFIGDKTFSSAVLNAMYLKKNTKALLVGHPASGSPNHFGEVKQFILPSTGLIVSYSTKYFLTTGGKSDTLYPDKYIKYSFNDFINGMDPAYEFVKKY